MIARVPSISSDCRLFAQTYFQKKILYHDPRWIQVLIFLLWSSALSLLCKQVLSFGTPWWCLPLLHSPSPRGP